MLVGDEFLHEAPGACRVAPVVQDGQADGILLAPDIEAARLVDLIDRHRVALLEVGARGHERPRERQHRPDLDLGRGRLARHGEAQDHRGDKEHRKRRPRT